MRWQTTTQPGDSRSVLVTRLDRFSDLTINYNRCSLSKGRRKRPESSHRSNQNDSTQRIKKRKFHAETRSNTRPCPHFYTCTHSIGHHVFSCCDNGGMTSAFALNRRGFRGKLPSPRAAACGLGPHDLLNPGLRFGCN